MGALRDALIALERLGARPLATLVARRLRERGERDIPRGPRPSTRANLAGLTARESEVLALLAAGLRNAEIATQLFIEPRTVERHISNLLAKLDVASRAAAVAEARRRGLLPSAPL